MSFCGLFGGACVQLGWPVPVAQLSTVLAALGVSSKSSLGALGPAMALGEGNWGLPEPVLACGACPAGMQIPEGAHPT